MKTFTIIFTLFTWAWSACLGAAERPAGEAEPATGQPGAESAFDVFQFVIDGNTVLHPDVVESAVYPYMGPGKSIEDVEAARQSLERAFHDAGYQTVAVDIPEQEVVNAVVRLQVTEGRLERVAVTGSRYFSLGRIRAGVPELEEGKVPHMPTLQAELEKVGGQSRDRLITPVLRAGDTPGTLRAELQVEDQLPLHGSLELNTRNSVDTSLLRLVATIRYDNLWQRFHSASLQFQTAPQDQDVEVWAGTYVMPLFSSDWRLALYGIGIDSSSDVSSAGALSVVGTGNIFGLRVVRPFASLGDYQHSLTFGVDYKDFEQSVVLVGADDQETPISYLPFTARYDGTWRHADSSLTSLGLGANFSIRGLGNDQQEFEDKRFLSRSNYLYINLDLRHEQALPRGFLLVGRFGSQVADSPLISNEQYSVGGADSVRGYHETEVLGDDGVFTSLELQTVRWAPDAIASAGNVRGILFLDGARVWIKEALPDTLDEIDLASVGLGVRFESLQYVVASLDWAYPLISAETVQRGDQRLHFRVAYEF